MTHQNDFYKVKQSEVTKAWNSFTLLFRLVTVSYTHLDVYKRQPFNLPLVYKGYFRLFCCGSGHVDLCRDIRQNSQNAGNNLFGGGINPSGSRKRYLPHHGILCYGGKPAILGDRPVYVRNCLLYTSRCV